MPKGTPAFVTVSGVPRISFDDLGRAMGVTGENTFVRRGGECGSVVGGGVYFSICILHGNSHLVCFLSGEGGFAVKGVFGDEEENEWE